MIKKVLKKYRGVVVVGAALVFNLVSSLLVWHPDGRMFNLTPMTVTEWVCDIIAIIGFFTGFAMMLFDANKDTKEKIKDAFLEANEELNMDKDGVFENNKRLIGHCIRKEVIFEESNRDI